MPVRAAAGGGSSAKRRGALNAVPQTVPQMEAGGVSGGQLVWSAAGAGSQPAVSGRSWKPASSQRPELEAGTGSQRRAGRTGRLACLALGAVDLRAGIGEGFVLPQLMTEALGVCRIGRLPPLQGRYSVDRAFRLAAVRLAWRLLFPGVTVVCLTHSSSLTSATLLFQWFI